MDDSLHGSQSDAGPLEVFLAVKPLEYPKEFIGVFRIEAHSVIPHEERQGTVGMARTYFNHRGLPGACESCGIGK